MKPALKSIFGSQHSFYSNNYDTVTAVGAGRYSLNNPIKSDGSLTKYAQIVMLVAKTPGLTKRQIFEHMNMEYRDGLISSTFQALIAGGLIQHKRQGRTFVYSPGSFFNVWKQEYLGK